MHWSGWASEDSLNSTILWWQTAQMWHVLTCFSLTIQSFHCNVVESLSAVGTIGPLLLFFQVMSSISNIAYNLYPNSILTMKLKQDFTWSTAFDMLTTHVKNKTHLIITLLMILEIRFKKITLETSQIQHCF